jgi:hypothetical protein
MSILQKLTEGIVRRDLSKEGEALLNKWKKTGLLEGIQDDRKRDGMAVLLENQAKELLREASAMSQGDVEGFAAVAFPLVRRVFGNLIANDIVSVQPMSLPSGLIFFMDFTYTDAKGSGGAVDARSIYGGGIVASQITGGVDLSSRDTAHDLWNVEQGPYSMNNAYSLPTSSISLTNTQLQIVAARSGSNGKWFENIFTEGANVPLPLSYRLLSNSLIQNDPDLSGSSIAVFSVDKSLFTNLDTQNLVSIQFPITGAATAGTLVRRLTRHDPVSGSSKLIMVFATSPSGSAGDSTDLIGTLFQLTGASGPVTYAVNDGFTAGGALGSVVGTTPWGLEGAGSNNATLTGTGTNTDIPEIDLKVDSVAVTAITRKLKAKWTPELAQDLNAYHNLDAEVELTSILSEQIALEIDREILNDLIKGATAGTQYWSRKPGKFVDVATGIDITGNGAVLPDFTGTVSAWYETLIERLNDVSAQIHRKTLRGGANFIVTSPEVANILEFTAGFRGDVQVDSEKGTVGTVKVGSINKKWDVYVDPYFVRNMVLIGRKGSSFLESGYVYAPYVPLQVTPTIFGTEDFVPRKGVLTRYAKKMVRPDMYGLVIIADLVLGNNG